MTVIVTGLTLLAFWILLCVVVVRYDVEGALWRLMALFGNFFYLTMAAPHVLDPARWLSEAATKTNLLVLAMLSLSALFVFEIVKMVRVARQKQRELQPQQLV